MAKITNQFMLSLPQSGNLKKSEGLIHGHGNLIGRITPSGERIFYFRYLDSRGRRIDYRIGTYLPGGKGMSVEDARAHALDLAKLHASGIKDIREHLEERARKSREAETEAERQRQAEAEAELARLEAEKRELEARKTVSDLFSQWHRIRLSKHRDGGTEVARIFNKDVLPEIGHLFAATITRAHITQVTDRQLERGTSRLANRTFTLMRQMFRFGLGRGIVDSDPTETLTKANIAGKETERDRVLTEDEVRELYRKLPGAGLLRSTECAVWIALSTCCRIGELAKAEWGHVDLERGQWFIPGENSKNGKPHVIFLSAFAEAAFRRLKAISGGSAWCYPRPDGKSHLSVMAITRQLSDRQKGDKDALSNRTRKARALLLARGAWTPHDLRRTGATMMVALGVLPEVAERCLNHTEQNQIKRIYQRYSYENEMREAWRLLGERLDLLATDQTNIITLGDRRTRA